MNSSFVIRHSPEDLGKVFGERGAGYDGLATGFLRGLLELHLNVGEKGNEWNPLKIAPTLDAPDGLNGRTGFAVQIHYDQIRC